VIGGKYRPGPWEGDSLKRTMKILERKKGEGKREPWLRFKKKKKRALGGREGKWSIKRGQTFGAGEFQTEEQGGKEERTGKRKKKKIAEKDRK